ncbi:hypothetical protein ACFOLJ_20220 [Rugamonas sp. CCM 8940]|uniref:hypothetical protein n=1 Tax=Rugamonas sp. CCM 8940 TaxID=2765359 RepID=UPI0018F6C689|nr:hypothetical protein [Rugamonas sp. CCM 8940]MBJ7313884.1 hypothetical protein [Rugamonas sp. CCM 8940]
MMDSILGNVMVISLVLPLIQVAGFWYIWREKIASPWWFSSIGLFGMYMIMAMCLSSTFSNIGVTGNISGTSGNTVNSLAMHYIGVTLIGVIVATAMLWGLRKFFGK